jgi:hypothetical protein
MPCVRCESRRGGISKGLGLTVAVGVCRVKRHAQYLGCRWGDLAKVQRLIGEDPSLLNASGVARDPTPLMRACEKGHLHGGGAVAGGQGGGHQ